MFKQKERNLTFFKQKLFFLVIVFILSFISFHKKTNKKYAFFIEFNDANGIVIGTPIRMRGIAIGFINNIQLKVNSVLVSATINSDKTFISKNSIIETSQTGLLNESVVDIIPLEVLENSVYHTPLSSACDSSSIICNNMYLSGERGLNYDDLVRATTRISQRFDDPSFFYMFCNFLEQSIELAESFFIFFQAMLESF